MNLPSIRARHDEAVTIGEVLAESKIVPAGSFDSGPPANYFDRSTRLAMHELAEPSIAPLEEQAGKPNDTPSNGDAPQQATMSTIYREIPGEPSAGAGQPRPLIKPRFYDKLEAFVSKLSMRDNFWNGICSLIWLPLAFFSGIRMKELDANSFAARAVLPFRRFNRNWYRAMAGGALLANSEIAGGSYVFGICGADYTVVCKNLNYTFLRPCFGPAIYRMQPREDIKAMLAAQKEFNITIDMDITQQAARRGEKDKRVGRCEATFHVTPKAHHQQKRARRRA